MFPVNYRNSTALVSFNLSVYYIFLATYLNSCDLYLKKSLAHVTTCFNLFKEYFKEQPIKGVPNTSQAKKIKGHIHVLVSQEDLTCREID